MESHDPVVLGWRERIDLPLLGIGRLRAKIDSGARSSCLHVEAQWRFVEAGAPWVGFRLRGARADAPPVEAASAVIDERIVTDSGGHPGLRPFIRTRLALAGLVREIEINLADRRRMRFPMLIGRSAMRDAFIVDPSRSWLHNCPRRRSLAESA
ncbi:ATP-dependent zinc protease [Lysobacter pythonis]|uniref:ATP-dependent zinc protease n=1 Tax=Solilutibacter pythonis TaxID=2483112 RepID=A0A3M2HTS2_9GAMM|nr:RimK/LysX family protein [Lysobacter pythonis]RMH91070.1 ATP-dependent zinc protease [Lysobacter pythonis]